MTLASRKASADATEDSTVAELANPQVATLAVYLAGGAIKNVDTEHIAVQAHRLAPGRYRWKHYPEQIDIEKVAESLRDAQKAKYGHLVQGARGSGWMLTPAGLEFAGTHLEHAQRPDLVRAREEPWVRPERLRLLTTTAYALMEAGTPEDITDQDLEAFFRIDDYVTGAARTRKVDRLVNQFHNDPDLGPIVRALAARIHTR